MSWKRAAGRFTAALAITLASGVPAARADHQWGCYKWPDPEILWYNGGTGDYFNIYQEEMITDGNSWHNFTVIQVSAGGEVQSYNAFFGDTGWLGLAAIYPNGCTITAGYTYMNETYLENGFYTRTNKSHVACQELGHTFGLDHNRTQNDTCMNDTILNAPQPNAHDAQQLLAMYGGGGPPPPSGDPPPPPGGCGHDLECFPSLHQCEAVCCGVCERRINCGGATAHKCFEN